MSDVPRWDDGRRRDGFTGGRKASEYFHPRGCDGYWQPVAARDFPLVQTPCILTPRFDNYEVDLEACPIPPTLTRRVIDMPIDKELEGQEVLIDYRNVGIVKRVIESAGGVNTLIVMCADGCFVTMQAGPDGFTQPTTLIVTNP